MHIGHTLWNPAFAFLHGFVLLLGFMMLIPCVILLLLYLHYMWFTRFRSIFLHKMHLINKICTPKVVRRSTKNIVKLKHIYYMTPSYRLQTLKTYIVIYNKINFSYTCIKSMIKNLESKTKRCCLHILNFWY